MRAVEVPATTSSGYDVDEARGEAARRGRVLRRGRLRRAAGRPRSPRAATGRRPTPKACAGFDVAVITVPTPLREGVPDLSYIEAAAATLAALPAARRHRRPRVDHLPGHHRGAGRAAPRGRARAWRPAPTSTSATARSASTPATPTWTLVNTPEGRVRHRRRVARRGAGLLRHARRAHGAGVGHHGGRADQAAGEHLPARQHRPGQRAGDVRRTTSASTCGRPSTPPRPSRSATCASPRAPASAATACPSTRATCRGGSAARSGQTFRFVELANDVNDHMPDYVVRRLVDGAQPRSARRSTAAAILLLGLAYKRNTGDARESPAVVGRRAPAARSAPRCGPPTPTCVEDHVDRRVTRVDVDARGAGGRRRRRAAHRPRRLRLRRWSRAHARYVLDTRHRIAGERRAPLAWGSARPVHPMASTRPDSRLRHLLKQSALAHHLVRRYRLRFRRQQWTSLIDGEPPRTRA